MKHSLTLLFNLLLVSQIEAQQITNTFPDTIAQNTPLLFETSTIVRDNGSPPSFCSPLVDQTDSINGNDIFFDLTYDITGFWTTGCVRKDTFSYQPLPAGDYRLICHWRLTDTMHNPPFHAQSYRYDTLNIHVQNLTSLEEFNQASFHLFPNPTNHTLNIEGTDLSKIVNYEIWDINGRKIRSTTLDDTQKIDVSDFPKGTYMLRMQTTDQSHQEKFVIF